MVECVSLDRGAVHGEWSSALVDWVFASGPAFFCALFGSEGDARRGLTHWIQRDDSEFSYSKATMALFDGTPAGILIAVPGAEVPRRRRADLLTLIRETPASGRNTLQQKLANLVGLTGGIAPTSYYVRTLSVDAQQRGRGVAQQLMRSALVDAAAAGLENVQLDVAVDNQPALTLYGRLGFVPISRGAAPVFGLEMQSMLLKI